jgi:DNA invertase Pin-like site-specific DNA recombinase
MRAGKYGAIVIWKLDRLGRSTIHLLQLLEEFRNKNIQLVSTTNGIDTNKPEGRFFFTIIAAFAELEREFIKQRVQASIDTKRANGIRLGRPAGAKDKGARRKSGYIQRWANKPRKGQTWYQKDRETEARENKQ